MDGREGMPPFYLNRGISGSGSHVGSGSEGGSGSGVQLPSGFKNPNLSPHGHSSTMRVGVGPMGSTPTYPVEHKPSPNFPHDINMSGGVGGGSGGISGGGISIATPGSGSDPVVKKKRGRPRKYSGDGSHMALALIPGSSAGGSGSITPKKNRGRPPGSGRKQRLADVGEWMSTSAGLAFTPHIIRVDVGEDVAGKILAFAHQRPRAVSVMSATGSVSAVQLCQFESSSGGTMTYEGLFEILSLTGSYLLPEPDEAGAPNKRTGGLSISICSHEGHVIGGALGGKLIASSMVQVMACSFVYGGTNSRKTKTDTLSVDNKSPGVELNETSPVPSQPFAWPQDSRAETRGDPHTDIDLTRG